MPFFISDSRKRLSAIAFASVFALVIIVPLVAPKFGGQVVPALNASCSYFDAPVSVTPGQRFVSIATMQNTGTLTWITVSLMPGQDFLGSQDPALNAVWGIGVVPLYRPVTPGGLNAFAITATAPLTPGVYPFDWQMVRKTGTNYNWYGQKCTKQITVVAAQPGADLSISKSGAPTIEKGTNMSYQLMVQNGGPQTATQVVIKDQLPAGLSFISSDSSPGCTEASGLVTCTIASIPVNQTNIVRISVGTSNAACGAFLNNTATISSAVADPNMLNNQSNSLVTTVTCLASFSTGTLDISVNGPASQTYPRGQQNALLANAVFTSTGEPENLQRLYIALQANTSAGGTLVNDPLFNQVVDVLQNVTLRNPITGQSISGVRLTGAGDFGQAIMGTYQIYRFDNVPVNATANYDLRASFINNGSARHLDNGDTVKAHICGEPTVLSTGSNTTPCTFGGLVNSTAYQLAVQGVTSGLSVVNVTPRGTISGNAHRVLSPALTITQKATATFDTAVKNQKNVNLLSFEGRSNEVADLLLTRVIAASASGSLNNAQNYALWVDTDANGVVDTKLQSGVFPQGGLVTFANLSGGGFVIPHNQAVIFEVHADIAGSLANTWLQLQFAKAQSNYIEAQNVAGGGQLFGIRTDGVCAAPWCDITVTTTNAVLYHLVSSGDLYVTKDAVSLRNHQLLGGTLGDAVLRLSFHAENEDIDVTDLQLTALPPATITSVDRLELYKDGATTPFVTATVGACGSDITPPLTMCAKMQAQQLVIPKGQDVKVLVLPRLKTDVDGAFSNEKIQWKIVSRAVSNNATGEGAVRARGYVSSNNLLANNGNTTADGEVFIGRSFPASSNQDIVGLPNVSVLSKIASITNANPDANGTGVPTGLTDFGQFKISAAANTNSKNGLNKVVLSDVFFTVSATNVSMDTAAFSFYNKANSTILKPCTPVSTTGAPINSAGVAGIFLVHCTSLNASSVNVTIDQGADATFVLRGSVLNPQIVPATSMLQASLASFNDMSLTTFGATGSHFQWLDQDTASTTQFNWVESSDSVVKSTLYQS